MNAEVKPEAIPVAWTIGGSDSCGGAGIQADLKTMQALSVHGCSAISSVTAQNTRGVGSIEPVSRDMMHRQLHWLNEDLKPRAIKLGMLYSREIIDVVADFLEKNEYFVVCDPVMLATSGDSLLMEGTLQHLKERILPQVDLVTPNLLEAKALANGIRSAFLLPSEDVLPEAELEIQAKRILALGPKSVLIKGGHAKGPFCQDHLVDRQSSWWFTSQRQDVGEIHGTGCTLSAAITAAVASGHSVLDAIVMAKSFINRAIRRSTSPGSGSKLLAHHMGQFEQSDLPSLAPGSFSAKQKLGFAEAEELGLYAILPSVRSLRRAIRAGIKTAQLRIKTFEPDGFDRSAEIRHAIEIAKNAGCRLYINDYWQEAIKFGAYGVHLGQEDLREADLEAIAGAGLRLGISTHSHSEVSRALAIQPSYIAVGPIFPTTTKEMNFSPQGVQGFKFWRDIITYPLVAIGGIFLSNAASLLQAGADGIAVVRALEEAENYDDEVSLWHQLLANFGFNSQTEISPLRGNHHERPVRVR